MSTHQISLGAVRADRLPAVDHRVAGGVALAQPDRPEPWRRGHLVASLALGASGCLAMVVCWWVGAGKLTYHDQVPWLVGSIASAGVTVLAGVVWLVCGFRQVSLLERDLLGYLGPWLSAAQPLQGGTVDQQETDSLVITAGMRRAHRPGCLLVRGKTDLTPMTQAEASVRALPTCGVCGS